MTGSLMISVSGMRGVVGRDLTPELVARHASALGAWASARKGGGGRTTIVLGRDSRTSGAMLADAAASGLRSVGCDVIDLGIVATPTTQLAVEHHGAGAGIMLSASHNPIEWNALKLVGPDGAFLDAEAGRQVRALAEEGPARADWDGLGERRFDPGAIERHLAAVLALPGLDVSGIRERRLKVALDCVRGAGGAIIPDLLRRFGCRATAINLETDGRFPREPEPLPEHLGDLGDLTRSGGAAVGFAVDPDVDRLALVDETGRPIGEDYTLALAVRAWLGTRGGSDGARTGGARPSREAVEPPVVVANLSTSLVVEDAARDVGARFVRAPVGEAHVVAAMRREGAAIGGEGNGGVILPSLHMGRDAPVGVALVLQYLATLDGPLSRAVQSWPAYSILKAKLPRGPRTGGDRDPLAEASRRLEARYPDGQPDRTDGFRLSWPGRWVHLRPSGTEPVVRVIAEAGTEAEARELVDACTAALG